VTLDATAQAKVNTLRSDAYLDGIKVSRVRQGVDIYQLKDDMATILAGTS
jgi:hypothetical protein